MRPEGKLLEVTTAGDTRVGMTFAIYRGTTEATMNLHLNPNVPLRGDERRTLWDDNLAWWVNCLAIERFWLYEGSELLRARDRRDALLSAMIEE